MASSSRKLIAIDPTQLTPVRLPHQHNNKRPIHPQNVFKRLTPTNTLPQDIKSIDPIACSDTPIHPSELAIHPKKIETVRNWLNDSLNGPSSVRRYRRLLVISGPAGSGKSSLIHAFSSNPADSKQRIILPIKSRARKSSSHPLKTASPPCEGLGYEILEWKNTGNESSSSKLHEFSLWLMRATAGPTLSFEEGGGEEEMKNGTSGSKTKQGARKKEESNKKETPNQSKENPKRVLLVDDLPNLYHQDTLKSFTNSLRFHLNSSRPSTPPLIISITDTNYKLTGEDLNANQHNQDNKPLNVHNVLPLDILNHPACFLIKLLPVNKTLMKKFLLNNLDLLPHNKFKKFTSSHLDLIVDSSSGDLRSALNNLHQFSLGHLSSDSKLTSSSLDRQLLSSRDESLVIFHGLGKILYNKRWGDDPTEDAKDKRICGPKLDKLPPFWLDFHRRLAKTNVDKLYAELSVPVQHFIIYLHHNYPQFLNSIEEGSFWLEYLSLTDSTALSPNDNNRYNQMTITEFYKYHVTVRSILLSLPSPVTRRNQKFYKPILWDNFRCIHTNLALLDSFRDDGKRKDSLFIDRLDLVNRPDLVDDDQLSFDEDVVSVIHSPRNLLAIEVLPFLGLISKFRRNNINYSSVQSNYDEEEIITRFTKFNYPKNNQNQEINEDDIGDDEEEEERKLEDDDLKNQNKTLDGINNNLLLPHDQSSYDKFWFEDDDDIVDD